MTGFLLALQFLTILPVKMKGEIKEGQWSEAVVYFPLVGLLLGMILATANRFLAFCSFDPFLINALLIILLIVLTGGLHLDGLADTFDAVASGKNKTEMLRIMRESAIGAMGTLALISIILIKVAALSSLDPSAKGGALIGMCVLGRYAMVFSMGLFPYARKEGKAKELMQGVTSSISIRAGVMTLVCSLFFLGFKGLLILAIVLAFSFFAGKWMTRKLGGMTGDTLGAVNELVEGLVMVL